MKLLWVMIISLSCSHASGVKINLYAKKILDIELPAKSVLPYCTIPGDPEKKNSWLGIYLSSTTIESNGSQRDDSDFLRIA
jgi:hypothetical protein